MCFLHLSKKFSVCIKRIGFRINAGDVCSCPLTEVHKRTSFSNFKSRPLPSKDSSFLIGCPWSLRVHIKSYRYSRKTFRYLSLTGKIVLCLIYFVLTSIQKIVIFLIVILFTKRKRKFFKICNKQKEFKNQ